MSVSTGTDEVLVTIADRVAVVTLNRPDRRNAVTDSMLAALGEIVEDCERSEDVRVLVLTGAGGAFCAGGDVKDFNAQGGEGSGAGEVDPARVSAQRRLQRATVQGLYEFSKPTIAALPGAVAGAGIGLALATDLRVASTTMVLATAFTRVALSGDYGATWLLQRILGRSRTLELMYSSARVDSTRALELGLVNSVVAPEELDGTVMELARSLAQGPQTALLEVKRNVNANELLRLGDAMDREVEGHMRCGITADHREAVAAFVEKRPARFSERADVTAPGGIPLTDIEPNRDGS